MFQRGHCKGFYKGFWQFARSGFNIRGLWFLEGFGCSVGLKYLLWGLGFVFGRGCGSLRIPRVKVQRFWLGFGVFDSVKLGNGNKALMPEFASTSTGVAIKLLNVCMLDLRWQDL